MNLQNYIEQIKGWIDRQYFLVRHYRIVIVIFFVLTLGMIVVGIFYPQEEESINMNSALSEGSIDNQRKADSKEQSQGKSNNKRNGSDKGKSSKEGVDNKAISNEKDGSSVKGRLLYDVSSVERFHPWQEVFKDISSLDILSEDDEPKDIDNDLDTIRDDEISLNNGKQSSSKRAARQYRVTKNKITKTDRKSKNLNGNITRDDMNNYSDENIHSRTGINSKVLIPEQPIELVGVIEGNQNIAILRRGSEEQMVTIGSSWQGISVSAITENSVEIVEGGSSRWLKIE